MENRLASLGAALAGLTLVLAGCGSGDDDRRDDDRSTGPVVSGEWSVGDALAELPASSAEGRLYVQTGDLVAALEAAGVERSDDPAAWLSPLTGGSPDAGPTDVFVPLAAVLHEAVVGGSDRLDEVVGIGLEEVDSFVSQEAPPTDVTVIAGDFDAGSLSEELVEDGGVLSDIEGDDLAADFGAADVALSRLGRPTRIRAEQGAVVLTPRTELALAWRVGETLADLEGPAAVASALDAEDVYSAVLLGVESAGAISEAFEPYVPETGYDTVGVGWAHHDGTASVHVAYHFADDADAASALPTLEEAWREAPLSTGAPIADHVRVLDSSAEGAVATISLTLEDETPAAVVNQMLTRREVTFTSR